MSTLMNDLTPGTMSPEHFEGLIALTRITGQKIVDSLRLVLVDGLASKDACEQMDSNPHLISRKLNDLRAVNSKVAAIYEFYDPKNRPQMVSGTRISVNGNKGKVVSDKGGLGLIVVELTSDKSLITVYWKSNSDDIHVITKKSQRDKSANAE